MIILYLVVMVVLLAIFLVFFAYSLDVSVIGHDFATTRPAVHKVGDILKSHSKEEGIFFDLGSSRGGFIFKLSEVCPRLQITGIDYSAFRVFLAKMFNGV